MPKADVWYQGNDMRVRLSGLRSSTMTGSQYVNNSAGVTVSIWSTLSTGNTANRVRGPVQMTYVSGSNGVYQRIIHSTSHSMTAGTVGMAIIKVDSGNLDGEWRPQFRVSHRRTT